MPPTLDYQTQTPDSPQSWVPDISLALLLVIEAIATIVAPFRNWPNDDPFLHFDSWWFPLAGGIAIAHLLGCRFHWLTLLAFLLVYMIAIFSNYYLLWSIPSGIR